MHVLEQVHVVHRAWRMRLRHNRYEIQYIRSRNLRGATVVDVGANRGVYSYWMHLAVRPNGNVIAFEPQPELVDYLHDLKKTFHLHRVTIEPLALSSAPGEGELTRPSSHWGAASLGTPMMETTEVDRLAVRVSTLDEYFKDSDLRPVRFIKVDIEGHEFDFFRGGERVLREDRPELLFECFDEKYDAVFPLLESLDYVGFFFLNGTLTPLKELARCRPTMSEPHLNFVFVPAERSAAR